MILEAVMGTVWKVILSRLADGTKLGERAVLPSRGTSTGWRDGLVETSVRRCVKSCT